MEYFRLAILAGAALALVMPGLWAQEGEPKDEAQEAQEAQGDFAAETATHQEIEPLTVEFEQLSALKLHPDGRLLACDAGTKQLKIICPTCKHAGTVVDLEFAPEAIDVAADGTIYCGGQGKLAKLSSDGEVLKMIDLPGQQDSSKADKNEAGEDEADDGDEADHDDGDEADHDDGDEADHDDGDEGDHDDGDEGDGEENKDDGEDEADDDKEAGEEKPQQPLVGRRPPRRPRRAFQRPRRVSGIAATEKDVFVAYGTGWSLRSESTLHRFDRDLENETLLTEKLRGCCQRCDIVATDSGVFIAENSRYRVLVLDRDGNELADWGGKSRKGREGFGACCNPMNLCFDAEGTLYTAESGLGRVKRYTIDGELLDLVGYVDVTRFNRAGGLAASCSNIAIAVTPDGDVVYVMDYKQNTIRVLKKKQG